jgi:hypothetical protein
MIILCNPWQAYINELIASNEKEEREYNLRKDLEIEEKLKGPIVFRQEAVEVELINDWDLYNRAPATWNKQRR